jgi:O-6-methylguanine DNA methyltransferase
MTLFLTRRPTPLGEVVAWRTERGLVAMGFSDGMQRPDDAIADPDPTVGRAIDRYFAGSLEALDQLELDVRGTPLQQRIWRLVRSIPAGETRSYAELGAAVGTSGRVVGNAVAANPACLALPCHRVVRSDGAWSGYAHGGHRKRWLLLHEQKETPNGPTIHSASKEASQPPLITKKKASMRRRASGDS